MSVFGIFRKNKRTIGFRRSRIFGAIFLLLTVCISMFSGLTRAADVPVRSVEILSNNSSYVDGQPGSWKITKSAKWTDVGKARITFEVESVTKYDSSKNLDVLMVIDNSGSMGGDKIAQVKTDATDLITTLLSDANNNVSLVTFNTGAEILSGFTNDKENALGLIDSIETPGNTNYYQGLLKAEQVLEGYEYNENRELILLFLTDGFPNNETPNEIAQYKKLKTLYPFMAINGIQYEMGEEVLQPIINVSDNQYIATMTDLNNVLFEATVIPYVYDDFVITDYIDNRYWNIDSISSIKASLGMVSLEYEGSTPKVIWDMSKSYHSGSKQTLTIDINLKAELINEDLLLPTNTHETIESTLKDTPDEDIDSNKTPILKSIYDVIYEANAPNGCEVQGTVPETTAHTVFTNVEISDNALFCPGYVFKGWRVATTGVSIINEDYFRMPEKDVYVRAVWSKLGLSKSMSGEMHVKATATFDTGSNVNVKLKKLSGQSGAVVNTNNTTITAIKRADLLSVDVNMNDSSYIISTSNSMVPIYAWYDEGTIYYYTDAEVIYLNSNCLKMFHYFSKLVDIDALADWKAGQVGNMQSMFSYSGITDTSALASWDTSKVTDMTDMFYYATSLVNIDSLSNWSTESLSGIRGMFSRTKITNVDALADWDTSRVADMQQLFYSASNLANIDGLSNWDTSKATNMGYTFSSTAITNLDALANWDTGKVTRMNSLFAYTKSLTNIDGIANWNLASVTTIDHLFGGSSSLANIDAIANWRIPNVTSLNAFLYNTKLQNLNALSGWDITSVSDIGWAFSSMTSLTDISGLSGWNTTNVNSLSYTFFGCSKLVNIDALSNWNTENVSRIDEVFHASGITNVDALASWNVEKVTNMAAAFSYSKLANINGIRNWVVANVTNFKEAFAWTKITNIDALAGWNMGNVTDMSSMFEKATMLSDVTGARNWNTAKVENVTKIFYGDTAITDLSPLNNWDVTSLTTMTEAFSSIPDTITRPTWYSE